MIIIPRGFIGLDEKEFQENSLSDYWTSWINQARFHPLTVPLPNTEEQEVINFIDSLIKNKEIKKKDTIINYIPSIDISAWSGIYEIVILEQGMNYPNDIVTTFRRWSFEKNQAPGILFNPKTLSDHKYIISLSSKSFNENYDILFDNNQFKILKNG